MRSDRTVLIRGDGVAAYCCAHLLKNAGFQVAMERPARPRVPAIMLSDAALALIRDVFEKPNLFRSAARIDRRVVRWGPAAEPVTVGHSAAVVSESVLLEELAEGFAPDSVESPGFIIHTAKPLPQGICEMRFGSRRATAAEAMLKDQVDISACWIESTENGWLFLIPNASQSTWLLAVGAPIESLVAESRIIAPRIDLRSMRSGEFPTCPRIATPLCGDGWVACGTAALAFDPICGDGTAQAVREGILASAMIRAIADGGDARSLGAHYEARLTAGMLRHLGLCAEFYRTGGTGRWWQTELASLADGERWCAAKLSEAGEPRYQLRGFELACRA